MADRQRMNGRRFVRHALLILPLTVSLVCLSGWVLWRGTTTPPAFELVPQNARVLRQERSENDFTGTFDHHLELVIERNDAEQYCRALGLPIVRSAEPAEFSCGRASSDVRHAQGARLMWRNGRASYHAFSR